MDDPLTEHELARRLEQGEVLYLCESTLEREAHDEGIYKLTNWDGTITRYASLGAAAIALVTITGTLEEDD